MTLDIGPLCRSLNIEKFHAGHEESGLVYPPLTSDLAVTMMEAAARSGCRIAINASFVMRLLVWYALNVGTEEEFEGATFGEAVARALEKARLDGALGEVEES